VIARNTAFTYKGKPFDVKQIGRELNARYVLEGSVQRSGNRLRVNVQLINAESGAHLWAERFDKPVADLFDMQDEIVARLANQLRSELIAFEARRAEQVQHPQSIDLYFRGMASVHVGGSPTNLSNARDFFEQVVTLDPGNVEALVGLAHCDAYLGVACSAKAERRGSRQPKRRSTERFHWRQTTLRPTKIWATSWCSRIAQR